jgi:hypothetical protein
MTLELNQITPRLRTIALGAFVALACSACASEQTVATIPAGSMGPSSPPPGVASAYDSSRQVASSGPVGYPMPNNGSGLMPSTYTAPTSNR